MTVTPPDRIIAHVFDTDGKTHLAWLPRARNCSWMEINSRQGWGTFEVPLTDATTSLIDFNRIVRLSWLHKGVKIAAFNVRIEKEAAQLAVDGIRWLRFEQQPGLLGLLGDAGVDPEGGLEPDSPDTRNMGFMSPANEAGWYIASSWKTPRTEPWGPTGGEHKNYPTDFRTFDKLAEWISAVDPSKTQPPFTDNYFRATLTLATATDVRIMWTADNYPDFYLDNQEIGSWGPPGSHQWKTANTLDMHLEAGDHLFAVRVKNSRHVIPDRPNPTAFIASIREVLATGKLGTVLLRTNATDWLVHGNAPEPGWHRAQVLHRLVEEAQGRGVDAVNHFRFGFGLTRDSRGWHWRDRDQYRFDIDGPGLAEIAVQLAETEMDVWIAPHGMRIMAARRRGVDRSGTVQLYLGDHVNGDGDQDGTLKNHEVTASRPEFTFGRVKLANGRWITVQNNTGTFGRIETTFSLGASSSDDANARTVARAQLDEHASMRIVATTETTILEGAIPYRHYRIGDTITVPGRRGTGTMKARVLAIVVDGSQDVVRAWPEYVEDASV